MSEYTPTTGAVRQRYSTGMTWQNQRFSIAAEEFDRWLSEERAKAFFEGVQHQWTHRPIGNRSPHNPYRKDES